MAFSNSTNVFFQMSCLDDPVVAPGVERVDPPPVIPGVRALAVCSAYESWREKEHPLLPGG